MSDKKRALGIELLDHLDFCREIGVPWLEIPARAARSMLQDDSKSSSRMPHSATTQPARSAKQVVFVDNRSMFDEAPTGQESLEEIRQDLGDCRRCKLAPTRTNIVFGIGNPHADLMFVGEAPGADEDTQGLPFVGRAGQLLTKILEAVDMKREDVYICNILKCRPPGNRNPESDEIASCQPFLLRQIASVKPKVICALGTFGAQTLLATREPISRLRGQFINYRGAKLMATFHPAYLLRNPNEKRRVWEDMQKIRDYLRSLHE